jgi:hypothetical protein
MELPLTAKERLGIQQSARVLRETIDQVEQRIGQVRTVRAAGTTRPAAGAGTNGRTVPRSAWQPARK